MLAALSQRGVLTFWDVAARRALGRPISVDNDVNASFGNEFTGLLPGASFTDSKTLITSNSGGGLTNWNLHPATWERLACRLAGRNLTAPEWHQYLPNTAYHKTCPEWPAGS